MEPVTDRETETVTDRAMEPVTDRETETVTDRAMEPVTDRETELVTEWIRHRFPTVENVCSDTVEQLVKENRERVLLVDTRSAAEYQVSHLEGAVRIDPETTNMERVVEELGLAGGADDKAVVCYCTVGFHASQLAQKLRNFFARDSGQNFLASLKVYNLEGGFLKWAKERKAMVDGRNQPTNLVHPYSQLWVQLLKAEFKAPA